MTCTTASTVLGFKGSPTISKLSLGEFTLDNRSPSALAKAKELADMQAKGTFENPLTPKQRAAKAAQLREADALAWNTRILRAYPAGALSAYASLGTVTDDGRGVESGSTVVQFSGTTTASLGLPVSSASVKSYFAYGLDGKRKTGVTFVANDGQLVASMPIHGIALVDYVSNFQKLKLTVPKGTGWAEVGIVVARDGQVASSKVSYEPYMTDNGDLITQFDLEEVEQRFRMRLKVRDDYIPYDRSDLDPFDPSYNPYADPRSPLYDPKRDPRHGLYEPIIDPDNPRYDKYADPDSPYYDPEQDPNDPRYRPEKVEERKRRENLNRYTFPANFTETSRSMSQVDIEGVIIDRIETVTLRLLAPADSANKVPDFAEMVLTFNNSKYK
jgi:hypothetical protein